MKPRKAICILLAVICLAAFAACGEKKTGGDGTTETQSAGTKAADTKTADSATDTEAAAAEDTIDYLVLVNKLNKLPEDWEDKLETVTVKNSLGDDVEVEKKAYEAYLELKAALEAEGVFVDLDSARRSVAAQQDIMDRFTEEYGADYAAKTVAKPGYSEHHTGLALDLYLNIDGEDVYYNEDMIEYPEVWAKIHAKLADYGFILRYLEDKEHITGYGYEPWHIRYVDDVDIAKEITEKGITLETYLGEAKDTDVVIDLGESAVFSEEELKEAVVQIKCKFAFFAGCELIGIRYAGDDAFGEDELERANSLEGGGEYTAGALFNMDFVTAADCDRSLDPDTEYNDYKWCLARTADGGWEIVDQGYC